MAAVLVVPSAGVEPCSLTTSKTLSSSISADFVEDADFVKDAGFVEDAESQALVGDSLSISSSGGMQEAPAVR